MPQPDPSQSPESEQQIAALTAALVAAYGFAVASGGAAQVAQFVTFAAGALASVLNAAMVAAEVFVTRLLPQVPVTRAVVGTPSPTSDVRRLEAAFTTVVEDASPRSVPLIQEDAVADPPPTPEPTPVAERPARVRRNPVVDAIPVEPEDDIGEVEDDVEDQDDAIVEADSAEDQAAFEIYRRFIERAEQRQRERIARIVRTEVKDRSREAFTAALARRNVASIWVANPGACDICNGLDGIRVEPGDEVPESHPGCGCRMRADVEFYDPYVTTGAA